MGGMEVLKVILYLFGFCCLLFLTYVTTRYIGGRQNRAMKGKHINVVETVALGMDKRLHLVKAGDQYVLIASTSKTVEFLSTVSLGESKAEEQNPVPDTTNLFDFKSLFEKYMGTFSAKKLKEPEINEDITTQDMGDNGSHVFKSNLGRLREITQKRKFHARENGDDITNEK